MFKRMAKEMTDKEVRICMSLLFDGSIIKKIERYERQNAIAVEFEMMNYENQTTYSVNLLPDCVEQLSEGVNLKPEGEYMYRQFTIARGYSEYWKDNIFL